MRIWKKAVAAASILLAFGTVDAAADDQTMQVLAQVGSFCVFDTMGSLDFGVVNPGDTVNASNQLMWTCSAGTNWLLTDDANFGIEDGAYSGQMVSGGNTLDFSFTYTPTSGTSTGAQESATVSGTIIVPIGQASGSYSSSVTFRIEP